MQGSYGGGVQAACAPTCAPARDASILSVISDIENIICDLVSTSDTIRVTVRNDYPMAPEKNCTAAIAPPSDILERLKIIASRLSCAHSTLCSTRTILGV